MRLMKILFLCVSINSIHAMEQHPDDLKWKELEENSSQFLHEIGDYYEFEPSENGPLDEATVLNPFWQKVQALETQKEKSNFIKESYSKMKHIFIIDNTWAYERMRYAAKVYAQLHFREHQIPTCIIEALWHKDFKLLHVLALNEKIRHLSERDAFGVFNSLSASTIEGAGAVLDAGFSMPRRILHIAMNPNHEPALVDFYRKHGACPLTTDRESIPYSTIKASNLGALILPTIGKLPIINLALEACNYKHFSDVFEKFDGLTNNLAGNQLITMFEHNKEYSCDVIKVLKYNEHPHTKALLQIIEKKYAELRK